MPENLANRSSSQKMILRSRVVFSTGIIVSSKGKIGNAVAPTKRVSRGD